MRSTFIIILSTIFFASCSFKDDIQPVQKFIHTKNISAGVHLFPDGISVAEGEILVIEPGAHLKIGENKQILVGGKIVAEGTKESPITFDSMGSNLYWRGIRIDGLEETPVIGPFWQWFKNKNNDAERVFSSKLKSGNTFNYVIIQNISIPSKKIIPANKWKAAIEAYNTSLTLKNSDFKNILYIGNVLMQRSYALVMNNSFQSDTMFKGINATDRTVGVFYNNIITQHYTKNQRCADGIWIDDSTALISKNTITGVGDDGIDSEGSYTVVIDNNVKDVYDDGIDIDGKGEAYIIQNKVEKAHDNAMLISDRSSGIFVRNTASSSSTGLTIRDGARAAVDSIDIQKNNIGVLLFQNIPCALINQDFLKIQEYILSIPDDVIQAEKIPDVSSAKNLVDELKKRYHQEGTYWIFNKNDPTQNDLRELKDLFKLINFNLSSVDDAIINRHPYCRTIKNSLYVTSSIIKDNTKDLDVKNKYELSINDTIFSDNKNPLYKEAECTDGFLCSIVDQLNVSGIIYSAKKIIQKIDSDK